MMIMRYTAAVKIESRNPPILHKFLSCNTLCHDVYGKQRQVTQALLCITIRRLRAQTSISEPEHEGCAKQEPGRRFRDGGSALGPGNIVNIKRFAIMCMTARQHDACEARSADHAQKPRTGIAELRTKVNNTSAAVKIARDLHRTRALRR